jgi:hypothetical protein
MRVPLEIKAVCDCGSCKLCIARIKLKVYNEHRQEIKEKLNLSLPIKKIRVRDYERPDICMCVSCVRNRLSNRNSHRRRAGKPLEPKLDLPKRKWRSCNCTACRRKRGEI